MDALEGSESVLRNVPASQFGCFASFGTGRAQNRMRKGPSLPLESPFH